IGQGQVRMGPAQLALGAAGIARGTPAAPVEVVGGEPAGAAPAGPGPAVLDALRPMMRQVVLSGTATGLADRGEVYGKTGTAEYGTNTPLDAHGWFMGYQLGGPQGDVAFAVLVEGGQSSSVAVEVADAFLAALGG
ncbi:penicillin-binding transpeptidase domain-containing protein, partial [Modestobacter marinus]|uniref:penicillin-binding transpeptidase domain-containing protein n=1 Tax=Modestobacter marinus TaxID=477641 RepID=UPI00201B2AA5